MLLQLITIDNRTEWLIPRWKLLETLETCCDLRKDCGKTTGYFIIKQTGETVQTATLRSLQPAHALL